MPKGKKNKKYAIFAFIRFFLLIVFYNAFIGIVAEGSLTAKAFGAIYYVLKDSKDNSQLMYSKGAWPSDSNEEDIFHYSDLDQIVNSLSANDEIVISGGPVSEIGVTYYLSHINSVTGRLENNVQVSIRGCTKNDLKYENHGGRVFFDAQKKNVQELFYLSGGHEEPIGFNNVHIKNIAGDYAVEMTGLYDLNDVIISDSHRGILCSTTNGSTINRVEFFNISGNAIQASNANVSINYAYIHDCLSGSIFSDGNSQVTLNRATIIGNQGSAGYTESNGKLIINDSIIHTVCGFDPDKYPLYNLSDSGTIIVNYSLLLPNPNRLDKSLDERIIDDTKGTNLLNNCIYEQARFQNAKRPAIVYVVCDDTGNLEDYFIPVLAPKLEEYGWRGTMAITTYSMLPGRWAFYKWDSAKKVVMGDINLGLQGGHEICSHSHTHFPYYNAYEGMRVRYSGGGVTAARIYVKDTDSDGYADLVYTMVNNGKGLELDMKFSNLEDQVWGDNLIKGIADVLQATGRYQCILGGNGLSQYLEDADDVDILVDYPGADLNLNPDRVWRGEALRSKLAIEQNIGIDGYICKSWVSPGNQTSLELQLALLKYGYLGGRAGYNPNDSEPNGRWIEDLNIYSLKTNSISEIMGNSATQEDVERRVGAFIEYLMWYGGVASFYVHKEMTQEAWETVLQVLKKAEVTGALKVLTLGETLEFLRSYDPTGDLSCWEGGKQVEIGKGRFYKRTMLDNENCRLSYYSPCIDAGSLNPNPEETDLDGAKFTDANGDMLPVFGSAPDIGAYEYAHTFPGIGLKYSPVNPCRIIDTRLIGGAFSPGDRRGYFAAGSVATQGGNPEGCPVPAGDAYGLVVNVTAVPVSGNGNLSVFPYGASAPNASLVNYKTGVQNIANSTTVKSCKLCERDISIQNSYGSTHVIIDVLGYYYDSTEK